MSCAGSILRGDLWWRLRGPVLYLSIGLVLGLAALAVQLDIAQEGFAGGRTLRNAPVVVNRLVTLFGLLGAFFVGPQMLRTLVRDVRHGLQPLLFAAPITERAYFRGRFAAGLLASLGLLAGFVIGIVVGCRLPGVDPASVGAHSLAAHAWNLGIWGLPNLWIAGALFFAAGTLSRSPSAAYTGPLIWLLYLLAIQELGDESALRTVVALIDPLGQQAAAQATEHWTLVEQNRRFVPLTATVLVNRLSWVALAGGVLAVAARRFSFPAWLETGGRSPTPPARMTALQRRRARSARGEARTFGTGAWLGTATALAGRELRRLFAARGTLALMVAGGVFLYVDQGFADKVLGLRTYPVTSLLARIDPLSYGLFLHLALIHYSGLLVHRDDFHGSAEVIDSTPVPGWVVPATRFGAFAGMAAVWAALPIASGVAIQLLRGFTEIELGLYLRAIFLIEYPPLLIFGGLCFAVHAAIPVRTAGSALLLALWALRLALPRLGVEHPMLLFAFTPRSVHSDLTGFAPWIAGIAVLTAYWGGVALLLALVAGRLWPRGAARGALDRLALLRRPAPAGWRAACAAALVLLSAAAIVVFLDLEVWNDFTGSREKERRRAAYEAAYRHFGRRAPPKVLHADVEVDLRPGEGTAASRGRYIVRNEGSDALSELHLSLAGKAELTDLELEGRRLTAVDRDDELGFHRYRVEPPLEPGGEAGLRFAFVHGRRGLMLMPRTEVVPNGSRLGEELLPTLGYDPGQELVDPALRRRHRLGPRRRLADRSTSFAGADAGWITFDATVTTSADQIALAPGERLGAPRGEPTSEGRRRSRYRSEVPATKAFGWLSARYALASASSSPEGGPVGGVTIEVFHHPGHDANVDSMLRAAAAALEDYSARFGPYPYRTLRIAEFPRFAQGAFALPGLIPVSESFGFLLRPGRGDYDAVAQVIAHEVAHQWWGHQVVPSNEPGARLIGESLSQYASLAVLERLGGTEALRGFLAHQLERYLLGRSSSGEEAPLVAVESQPFVHSAKGALAMHAVREALGRERLDGLLRRYLERHRYVGPPYASAPELVERIERALPAGRRSLADDWFRRIVLYDNRLVEGRLRRVGDGWEVLLDLEIRKLEADAGGGETEVAAAGPVELAFDFGEGGETIVERRLAAGRRRLVLSFAERPRRATLDPRLLLIDRNRRDNHLRLD